MGMKLKSIIFAVIGGIVLYAVIGLFQSNSESFRFSEKSLVESTYLAKEVGRVEKVRVPLMGSYSERWSGSDARASMTLEVIGARRTIEIELEVRKKDGVWTVEKAIVEGKLVSLN